MNYLAYKWGSVALFAAAVLVAYLGYGLLRHLDIDPMGRPRLSWTPEAGGLVPGTMADTISNSEVEEAQGRPLFSATRRPFVPAPSPQPEVGEEAPPPPPPADEAPPEPPPEQVFDPAQFTLKGILVIDDSKRALIVTPDKPDGAWFSQGTEINAWKVEEIGESQVTISHGADKFTLKQYVDNPGQALGSAQPTE